MKKIMSWLTLQYKVASVPQRLYTLAMVVFISGRLLAHLLGELASTVGTGLAMAVLISGFTMWCLPAVRWLHNVWDRPFAKTPIVLLHVFVLLVATVLARSLVAEALGLPPQSFDLTTSFLVIFFYLPAWMIVAAVILAIVGIILAVITLLQLPLQGALQQMILFVRAFGLQLPFRQTRITVFIHSLGAFAASSLLLQSYAYLATNYQPWLYPVVRVIAIKSDFDPAPLYPGVKPGEHVHPLENGFIAVARAQSDDSVVISVRSQEGATEVREIGEPLPSVKQMLAPMIDLLRN